MLVAFLIVAVFAVSGRLIFEMFGIGLPAFRITGGLLVLHIRFLMLQGRSSEKSKRANRGSQNAVRILSSRYSAKREHDQKYATQPQCEQSGRRPVVHIHAPCGNNISGCG